jgi:hypothetical protein
MQQSYTHGPFVSDRTFGLLNYLCAIGFLVLFPGFFFYHTVIGLGLMPATLGGFFRPMALLFIFAAAWMSLLGRKPIGGRPGPAGTLYVCILGWIAVVAIWHYLIGAQVGNLEMLDWSLSGVLLNITCYLIGRHLPLHWKMFNVVLFVCLSGMILIVLLLARDGMFYLRAESLGNEEKTATYQGFARSLAMTGILAVALAQRGWARIALAVATMAALYLNGARSELVCFALALLALWAAYAVWHRGSVFPMVMLIALTALLPFLSLEAVQQMLPENRMLQLFDLAGSSSALSRADLSAAGWQEINRSPIFGNYAFYYATDGVGGYPHNISAAWVNLGIVGMAMYAALIALLFWMQVQTLTERHLSFANPLSLAPLLALVFTGVALLFAKDYSYMLLGFAVAFTDRGWFALRADLAPSAEDLAISK